MGFIGYICTTIKGPNINNGGQKNKQCSHFAPHELMKILETKKNSSSAEFYHF